MFRILGLLKSKRQIGPLEEQVLKALWLSGNATVRELLESHQLDVAYTTLMTTLDRLYKKQLLDRKLEGKAFRYTPRLTAEEFEKTATQDAIRELLAANDRTALPLSYFVEAITEHDVKLLDELQELLERKRRELENREEG
jgi:predicted transcriptional regulator